jgi:hypothetical protein
VGLLGSLSLISTVKKFGILAVVCFSIISVIPELVSTVHASACPTGQAQNKIEGCVYNTDTSNPVPGLFVFIVSCGGFETTQYTTTDSNGYFAFQGNALPLCIQANNAYPVSVNGVTP